MNCRRWARGAVAAFAAGVLCASAQAETPRAIPATAGTVEPTWKSIGQNYHVPTWFQDAKFGIFIHWGLYAVPAFHNEWYARHMYGAFAAWHTAHYGPPDKFGYKDFIPLFKAEKYDPDAWASLFKASGAKYVVPVAEHHDGFAMYDSDLTRWCAGKMGPKRDLIGDLAQATRKQGLVFGLSSHRMEHHTFMYPQKGVNSDQFDPRYADFYGPPVPGNMNDGNASPAFQADWLARCKELVDKYHPQMFWFDNGINDRAYDDVKQQLAAYYYNQAAQWGQEVSLSTKGSAYLAGSILDFEKAVRAPKEILSGSWQVDDQIGNSWGYVNGMTYRSAASIITELADTVSKGGNLLLNISPMADGTIPEPQQKILRDTGKWLQTNGEAIYGTHPWTHFGEGAIRYTVKGDTLYAICWGIRNSGGDVVLPSLSWGNIESVALLGHSGTLMFTQQQNGLTVKLPSNAPPPSEPFVLKISGVSPTAPTETTTVNTPRFHFGSEAIPGSVSVPAGAVYSSERGYGFEDGTTAEKGQSFLFSVRLPEGNYRVTVNFGDKVATSETTVKAELRRLMIEKVQTAPGQFITRTFTVNVRTPQITGGGEVHLKSREKETEFRNWDDRLTLEFDGNPRVASLEITPNTTATTVYLLGDSTVTDQPDEPWAAWGQLLPRFFAPTVAVANYAESGESLRSSLGAQRLAKVVSSLKTGITC